MLRSLRGGTRVVAFVLVAVFAQIFRNWLLLHAVGVDASFFDAIAVLIAVVTLGQLPVGPSVGAAAAVLILGSDGVAAAAAAGALDRDRHGRRALLRGLGGRRQAPGRVLAAPVCGVRAPPRAVRARAARGRLRADAPARASASSGAPSQAPAPG